MSDYPDENGGPGEQSESESAAAPSAEERLRELGMQLKQHIEYKEWDALERLLAIPSVWVIDRSMTVPEAVTTMRDLLGSAADIQLSLERVLRTNIGPDEASASLVVRFLWSEGETWAEHEENVDMHLGFKREGDDWVFSSLGFTATNVPQPEQAAAPGGEVRSEFTGDPQYLGAVTELMRMVSHPEWSTYFGTMTELLQRINRGDWPPSYLRAAVPPGQGLAPPGAPAVRSSHALVYMPVFVPSELLDGHLPK